MAAAAEAVAETSSASTTRQQPAAALAVLGMAQGASKVEMGCGEAWCTAAMTASRRLAL